MIKAVFFDMDDTMFCFASAHKQAMKEVKGYAEQVLQVSEKELEETLELVMRELQNQLGKYNPGIHNRQVRFQNVLSLLGKKIYPHATEMYHCYWDTVIACIEAEPGLINLLSLLKKKEVFVGVCTDMTSYVQTQKLVKIGVIPYIDVIVTNEEAGVDKPGKKIFELCLQKCEYEAEECIFIGDKVEKDMMGAESIGMNGMWYSKYSKYQDRQRINQFISYEQCIYDGAIHIGPYIIE